MARARWSTPTTAAGRDLADRWLRHVSPGLRRGPGADAAAGALRARYAPLSGGAGDPRPDARHGRQRRGRSPGAGAGLAGNSRARPDGGPALADDRKVLRDCGALARICFPSSTACSACRSRPSTIPRSTPAAHVLRCASCLLDQAAARCPIIRCRCGLVCRLKCCTTWARADPRREVHAARVAAVQNLLVWPPTPTTRFVDRLSSPEARQ
jgi:hypothetical protein